MSGLRSLVRLAAIGLWLGLLLPARNFFGRDNNGCDAFQTFVCRGMARIMGVRVKFNASAATLPPGRPVIYAANHMSYMDVILLGSCLKGSFVAKKEIEGWPMIGAFARAAKVIFIQRNPIFLRRGHGMMAEQMNDGRNVVLFPEGKNTSGDGVELFKGGMLCITFTNVSKTPLDRCPIVQPVSLRVTGMNGLPAHKDDPAFRHLYAWWGGQDIASHFWTLARNKSIEIEITEHLPLDPYKFSDRREFTRRVHDIVQSAADGPAPSS